MNARTDQRHPQRADLASFAVGRLPGRELERIAQHLLSCDDCCQEVLRVPDDHLTSLLRRPAAAGTASPNGQAAEGPRPSRPLTSSRED